MFYMYLFVTISRCFYDLVHCNVGPVNGTAHIHMILYPLPVRASMSGVTLARLRLFTFSIFSAYTRFLTFSQKKNCKGVISGILESQGAGPSLTIYLLPNRVPTASREGKLEWGSVSSLPQYHLAEKNELFQHVVINTTIKRFFQQNKKGPINLSVLRPHQTFTLGQSRSYSIMSLLYDQFILESQTRVCILSSIPSSFFCFKTLPVYLDALALPNGSSVP